VERHEARRRAAQHALLSALRQFCLQPLVELRDGLPPVSTAPAANDKRPLRRSRARAARIREARKRVQALAWQPVENPGIVAMDVDAWAERWHLHALRDLAPHLIAYLGALPSTTRTGTVKTFRPKAAKVTPRRQRSA